MNAPLEAEVHVSLESYADHELPSLYQTQIHLTKYARWNPDLHRRETWPETVHRYLSYILKQAAKHGVSVESDLQHEIFEAILNLEVMPSMRCMMTAGPALDRDAAAAYNCFRGDTKFLTMNGLRTFAETVGTQQRVLDGGGAWVDAEISCFGEQPLVEITFRPGRRTTVRHTVVATPDHKWYTSNRGAVTDLRVGDKVESQLPSDPFPYVAEAWIMGFGFGDGTIDSKGHARVRLCGKKNDYVNKFASVGHCSIMQPPSCEGDHVIVFHKGYFIDWKNLPRCWDAQWLASWLQGYLAADGCMRDEQPGISSQDHEAIEFVREIAPFAGYVVTGDNISSNTETNYGERANPLRRLTLRRECEFWVTNVTDLEVTEPVYCATVNSTASFTLANGIFTGNCSYLHCDRTESFDEAMYMLMCGSGVGFSVERQFTNQLPELPQELHPTDTTIHVRDSKLGWAQGLRDLIRLLYGGSIPHFDFSKVRPAGAPLKTFGGRASGPAPLKRLYKYVISIFQEAVTAQQSKLTSFQCHCIMTMIGEVVVAGGVRRSAMISFSNPSDDRMRGAKSGDWRSTHNHFRMANNSAAWTDKPSAEIFCKEWLSLIESKSGERGIFNARAAWEVAARNGRRKVYDDNGKPIDFRANPCQPDHATVLTPEGIRTFAEIEVGSEIWSGSQWTRVSNKVCTGTKEVFRYKTSAGVFEGTANHRVLQNGIKIEVQDAEAIDLSMGPLAEASDLLPLHIMDGLMIGDGTYHHASRAVFLYVGAKDQDYLHSEVSCLMVQARPGVHLSCWEVSSSIEKEELQRTWERSVPNRYLRGSNWEKRGFLRGLFSANGSICGGRVALKASSLQIIEQTQVMLSSLGIPSYYTTNKPAAVTHRNGTYISKISYDLNITAGKRMFATLIGFLQTYKNEALAVLCQTPLASKPPKKTFEIKEVETCGVMPVYDITVDAEEHTYWTGGLLVSNCAEIILPDRTHCNLTEGIIRPGDTFETICRKVRIAAILGTLQSTITHFRYLSPQWRKNAEEERLLGVSLTGIYDNAFMSDHSNPLLPARLEQLRDLVVEINKEWAEKLSINQSAATTTNKPSGTVSALVRCASGMGNAEHASWYIRRNRASKNDPIARLMYDAGIPCEDDVTMPETNWVFSFPMRASVGGKVRKDVTAMDQLKLWMIYQESWCEHKPSITVSVRDNEWMSVGAFVYENFDKMSGVSFLPYSEEDTLYEQLPFEEISENEYHELCRRMPAHVDWSRISEYEMEDQTVAQREYACSGGSCEIPE